MTKVCWGDQLCCRHVQQPSRGSWWSGAVSWSGKTPGKLKVPPGGGSLCCQVIEGNRNKDGHPTQERAALGRARTPVAFLFIMSWLLVVILVSEMLTGTHMLTELLSSDTYKQPNPPLTAQWWWSCSPLLGGEEQKQGVVDAGWESCLKWSITSISVISTFL